ncbi:TonB-dependent receptor [Sphingobium cupriresistens]|uniref:TonB-dependent receptor n=1 Tax=Sphingobium cupriresistens TaxID=1132417 RepID=UPI000AD00184|nr:TonB-dependent receptor [Sphingobium cupriresistens]
MKHCAYRFMLCASVAWLPSFVAHAQDANPADPQAAAERAVSPSAAQDIVVTARRREEKLADVPVAVEAFGNQAINDRGILTEADLQSATAGLTVRQTGSSNQTNFSLRGQSIDAFSFASPAVLIYFNEFNTQGSSASSFFDLESIQVIKGPQGTLFGRNATGGAVLYQSAAPKMGAFEGYGEVAYGNYNDRRIEGAVNVPLGDFGAFRLAAQYNKRDGFQRNLLLNIKHGSLDNLTIRPSLRLELSDNLTNTTLFQYGRYRGRSTSLKADRIFKVGEVNNGFLLSPALPTAAVYQPGVQITYPLVANAFSSLDDYIEKTKNSGFYDTYTNTDAGHRANQYMVVNTTTYDLSDDLTIKNIAGYNYVKSNDKTDVDGLPFTPLIVGFYPENSLGYTYTDDQISNELQLQGKAFDGKLDCILGAYFFHGMNRQNQPLGIFSDTPNAVYILRTFQFDNYSKALFGQASYEVATGLNFTAGARYTWELAKYKPLAGDINAILGVGPAELKVSKPSWNLSIDYKVTPSLMIYASQRGSWRTGGFNGTAFTVVDGVSLANQYEPETTYDFELGAKFQGYVGGRRASLNVALFDQYIKNVIRAVYIDVSAVSGNVKKARVSGAEVEGSIQLADWLQVGGVFSYTDARYTNPIANVGSGQFGFGPYADTPKYSGSAFFSASFPLAGDGGEIALRGDLYSQSKYYYSNLNASILPGTEVKGYTLANARLEWKKIQGSNVSVATYVKNLTNEKYIVGGFALGAVLGVQSVLPGVPRTYGAEVRFEF